MRLLTSGPNAWLRVSLYKLVISLLAVELLAAFLPVRFQRDFPRRLSFEQFFKPLGPSRLVPRLFLRCERAGCTAAVIVERHHACQRESLGTDEIGIGMHLNSSIPRSDDVAVDHGSQTSINSRARIIFGAVKVVKRNSYFPASSIGNSVIVKKQSW